MNDPFITESYRQWDKKCEAEVAREERVKQSAIDSIKSDELGNDILTEAMPEHKQLWAFFLASVENELKGEFVDYDTIGRNVVKTAAKFALEVADAEVE